jgi:hypothetical protein
MVALAAAGLMVASQAAANHITLDNPPSFTYVNDQQLADDQPGQKDLSSHASACKTLGPCDLWVSWKWDVTSLSGGNTGDACALFDTNSNLRVNSALCLTIAGNPATTSNTRVYSCGDDKVDRCSQPAVLVPNIHSVCGTSQPDNSDPFHAGQKDTVAVCHVNLADVQIGTSTPELINTCSYPSQEPNSAPSDCVLIIRDAFIRITKVADPANAGSFPFKLDGTTVFTASGSQTSSYFAISSKPNSHSVQEVVPSGWQITGTPSCTGQSGSGSSAGTYSGTTKTISGIIANSDNQITCTFNDQQQRATLNVTKTGSDSGSQIGAEFTLYTDFGTASQAPFGMCTVTALSAPNCGSNPSFSNLVAGTTYTLDETDVPDGYTKDADLPKAFTPGAGDTLSFAAVNTANPGSIDISKVDDNGDPLAGVTFQLYEDNAGSKGNAVAGKSCTTDAAGDCTISSIAAGTYWLDETNLPAGYAKDGDLPEQITVANGDSLTKSYTNARQFKVITIVCSKVDDTLYPSSVEYDDDGSPSDSLAASGLGGIDEGDLCGLGGAVHDDVGTGNHTSSIDIPTSQP